MRLFSVMLHCIMLLQVVKSSDFSSDHILLQVDLTEVPEVLLKSQGKITNLQNVLLNPNDTFAEGLYTQVSRRKLSYKLWFEISSMCLEF